MRRPLICLPLLICLVATTGCRRRSGSVGADAPSHVPAATTGVPDDRHGFELGPTAADARFTERDIPLSDRPASIDAFRDPLEEGAGGDEAPAGRLDWATVLKDIHFDFDSFALSGDAQATLSEIGAAMRANPDASIVIEGHCDERGSSSYNLALGERRALAVREFIAAMGVEGARMHTVSYGEEYPLAPGHDDTSWARNRRAHFRVKED